MVFYKYRPLSEWGRYNTRLFKMISAARNKRHLPRFNIPPAVAKAGLPVVDPLQGQSLPSPPSSTTIDHPAFTPPSLLDHPLYRSRAAILLDGSEPVLAGVDGACHLLKAVPRPFALPASAVLPPLPADIGARLQDFIMHAERFDPTLDRLPRQHDPILFWYAHPLLHGAPRKTRNHVLLDDMYRYAVVNVKGVCPLGSAVRTHLANLRCDRDEALSAMLPAALTTFERDFVVRTQPRMIVQTDKASPAWASPEQVAASSTEALPDVAPLDPSVGLKRDQIYNTDVVIARPAFPLHVHTILLTREQSQKYPWTREELAADAILNCFGAALASAMRSGLIHRATGTLSRPVLTRAVQLVDGRLDFVAFQLNTVDLRSKSGIKNIAWVDIGQRLYTSPSIYESCEYVEGLKEETFAKFLALLLSA